MFNMNTSDENQVTSETIFENYTGFLRENRQDLSTPSGFTRMIQDKNYFNSFKDTLTEGMSEEARTTVGKVLDRQREFLLEEAANVSASSFTHGWSVLSFPVLTDIFCTPICSSVMNTFPTSSPTLSIPRHRIKAKVKSYDGATTTEYIIPTHSGLVRPGFVTIDCEANTIQNVFTKASLSANEMKMNRRYTFIDKVVVNDGSEDIDIECNIRPDSRDHFNAELTFTAKDEADKVNTLKLNASVNYDTGEFTLNGIITKDPGSAKDFTFKSASLKLRFVPVSTINGRVMVSITNEITDITIDPNEDFLIELSQEEIQDYQSIFKTDLAATISEAIKRQILMNVDMDLAYFLAAAESEIKAQNAYFTVDLGDFFHANSGSTITAPHNVYDLMKAVVPVISAAMSTVKKNMLLDAQYLVCGMATATLLRSMQSFMASMSGAEGTIGWSGEMAQFMKLKVLESYALDANGGLNKMYLTTKAPDNALEKASIIHFVYNPLYVISEVTDGQQRNFVRSRTLIEVARTDGIACIEVKGTQKILGF